MRSSRLYFAAPLFTPEERSFNASLSAKLEKYFDVFLPQRDGLLLPGKAISSSDQKVMYRAVFDADISAMNGADVIFAVLNGRTIDEGVSFELGYSFALGKRCIGYWTDSRVLLPIGINPMISGALEATLTSEGALQHWLDAQAAAMSPS